MLQLYDMARAKEDHTERVAKADSIKADIAKTLDAVFDANNVLQVQNKINCFLYLHKNILRKSNCLLDSRYPSSKNKTKVGSRQLDSRLTKTSR